MKQVTQQNKTGQVQVESIPVPALKAGHLLVQVRSSVISAGTERASVESRRSSLWQRAKRQPDLVKKILEQVQQYGLLQTYRRVQGRLESTVALGYSAAGVVVAVGKGVAGFKPGDRVACAGAGYASHAEYVLVPKKLCAKIPKGVEFQHAAYTTIGAIALQGVRQASPALGETIVVIGLGIVGQLTLQILKANGCKVVAIDLDPWAVNMAKDSGADLALRRGGTDLVNVVRSFTHGLGADAVIITAGTKSNDPVELAGELCREKGRVVLVGDVGMELPRGPYYMKELDVRLSRSYGPGRYDPSYEEQGNDYPASYVRWTENRNMQEFLALVAAKKIDLVKVTTHHFPVEKATTAYALITDRSAYKYEKYLGIVVDYSPGKPDTLHSGVVVAGRDSKLSPNALKVGFLGAGNFAQASLLPHVQLFSELSLAAVCTGNGLSAKNVARQFGFRLATTNPKDILDNKEIGTVFIAARHHLHASYVVDALKAGKNIFVEKPLALNSDELKQIIAAYNRSSKPPTVLVGFNRRFSPHASQAKRFFENAVGPFMMHYRVNAGLVPATHWTRDAIEGGGRIIGEVCHFIDLMQFFASSTPVKVFAEPLGQGASGFADDDSVAITVAFENGSVGSITYLANGDPSVPKERLEISSTNRTAVIENFQRLTLYQKGRKREFKLSTVEKGHKEEVRQFLLAVRDGKPSPIPFENVIATTRATFKIVESLQLGVPVHL